MDNKKNPMKKKLKKKFKKKLKKCKKKLEQQLQEEFAAQFEKDVEAIKEFVKEKESIAQKFYKTFLFAFPNANDFANVENAVAQYGFMTSQDAGISDDEAGKFLSQLDNMKMVRAAIYESE